MAGPHRLAKEVGSLTGGLAGLTVGDLTRRTAREISEIKGIGDKSLKQIVDSLKTTGLHLLGQCDYIGVEWETGNVSSGHRSINRILLGNLSTAPKCIGGVVVASVASLAKYLTDRVTNYEELCNFAPVWEHL